ncbi:MAG: hypothetical protein ACYCWE_09765 [Eubacteriales bacterium]
MTHEEIYKLYRKTEYDSPKLLKVLADVCSITVTELNQIIKDGDEKSMPKGTRWTDEQHDIYEHMTSENAKPADIAAAMGVPIKAIHSKRSNDKAKLNSIHEPKEKPATVNKDFDDLFNSNDTYADCAPDIDTGEDISEINEKIRDLCELPDPPKPKPDYTESLIETLREESESYHEHWLKLNEILLEQEKTIRDQDEVISRQNELVILLSEEPSKPKPSPTPKQRTVFDEAHAALWSLESMAKRNGIPTDIIVIRINERIIAEASDGAGYDAVSINKKNPLAGTAIPTSGE